MRLRSSGLLGSVLALCSACAPALPSGSSASPAASPVATGPRSSTATPATPAPSPSTAWMAVPDQADVRAVQFQEVVWTGTRFVAVAIGIAGGGAFLDSSDGLTWHLQPYVGPIAFPMALASASAGMVAVGKDVDGRAASWHSTDGLSWSAARTTFGSASGSNTVEVTDVVGMDGGWLAVGREDPACQTNCGLEPLRALAWTSSDGLEWTRVSDQPSMRDGAFNSVARLGTGFVAVGSVGLTAAAWTSSDGTTWVRSADAPVLHPVVSADGEALTNMTSTAAAGGVVVAVGYEFPIAGSSPPSVRAWWSDNGVTWTEAAGDRFVEGQTFSVAATPRGFLAVGPSGASSCLAGVWASPDGRAWTCTTSDPQERYMGPYAAAASPALEIVVGLGESEGGEGGGAPGGVWWRPIP